MISATEKTKAGKEVGDLGGKEGRKGIREETGLEMSGARAQRERDSELEGRVRACRCGIPESGRQRWDRV